MRLSLFNKYDTLNDTSFQPITVQFTGPLVLHADPNEPLHVATKRYVDNKVSTGLNANNITSGIISGTRLPAFIGDASSSIGSTVFTLANTGVAAGNYTKFTVDAKGRITGGSTLTQEDIPGLSWNKINLNRPTDLAGYGITDAVKSTGDSLVGTITITGNPSLPLHAVNKQYVDVRSLDLDASEPTGTIIRSGSSVAPSGYLRCNGASLSKSQYASLYSVVGDAYTSSMTAGAGKPWKQQYDFNTSQSGDITGWTTGTNLPGAFGESQVIITKNRVYLLGGQGSGQISIVYTAPINDDGTLGAWTTGTSLPGELNNPQAIVTKNRVYLLGGINSSNVYTAPINEDGTLGTWTTGTSLPGALGNSQAIVTKNRVYLLGGSYSANVYTVPINEDGTIGAWTTGSGLPGALGYSQAIVTKNRVYLLGGQNGSYTSTVYTAPINEDGTLGGWSTGTSLPAPLSYSQAIVTKNRVYLLGGQNGVGYLPTVYTAPINEDGTLGAWTTGTSLPGGLDRSQVIITKNRVYLLGGLSNGYYVSTVYTAPFSGGSNDYSQYYNGEYDSVSNSLTFSLPDYTSLNPKVNYYIKYR